MANSTRIPLADKLLIVGYSHPSPGVTGYVDQQGQSWQDLPQLPPDVVYRLPVPHTAGLSAAGRCHRCGTPLRDGVARGGIGYCDDCWQFKHTA